LPLSYTRFPVFTGAEMVEVDGERQEESGKAMQKAGRGSVAEVTKPHRG